MNNLRRILVVADNSGGLNDLRAIFAELPPPWEVNFCGTESEGLYQLEQRESDVVFVDLKHGSLAGTQFLHEVWKRHPKTIRFLLGDAIEPDIIVACVLGAHQFLQKPFDSASLQAALGRAETIDRLVRNRNIQTLVSRMRTFPSRPTLYMELMRELRSGDPNPKVVGELVGKDLAISTKLIQIVNSAYYGMAQHISDPADAVLLLGMETTASLILSIEAFARFDKVKPIYFSIDKVWKHCQTVAHSARKIAEIMSDDPAVAKDAFTAGLLHDIGKLALALNFEEQYQGAIGLAQKKNLPTSEVEAEVFGASHAETGAYLLSLWGLPISIIEAVAGHHLPAQGVPTQFSALTAVHLANKLENEGVTKVGEQGPTASLDYPAELGLNEHVESFRSVVKGIAQPGTGVTQFITREQVRGKATPNDAVTVPYPAAKRKVPPQTFALAAACVLLICAVLGAAALFRKPKDSTPNPVESSSVAKAAATPAPKVPVTPSTQSPEAEAQRAFSSLNLQGIMFNGSDSTLMINGKSLKLGQEIEGVRIVAIVPQEITVQKGEFQQKLQLR